MPHTLQDHLVRATPKAAEDLIAAIMRLPEDKRGWSPMGDARTALDMLAECAILNASSADLIETRVFDMPGGMEEYGKRRAKLAADFNACKALFDEGIPKVVAAIAAVRDEDLGVMIDMPWGALTLAQIASYPYWNMIYHEGQVNYIASMLGCLD